MASDDESPASPLSSIASDEFSGAEDDDLPHIAASRDDTISVDSHSASTPRHHGIHPSKRRRIDRAAGTPLSVATAADEDTIAFARATSPADSISSDSSGEVPDSPYGLGAGAKDDEDGGIGGGEQVSVCKWTSCTAGDLGNMDALVLHLHEVHMPHRQKRYSCEWVDCPRKGQAQASGYALRAHMRSHTKEKPFYCALPECDRSFTRSDALAKHMRTVHETEALRPSDPIPKSHSGGPLGAGVGGNGNVKRIKLIFGGGKEKGVPPGMGTRDLPPLPASVADAGGDLVDIDSVPFEMPIPNNYYPIELSSSLSDVELALPPSQLYRLLQMQLHLAEQEGDSLVRDLDNLMNSASDLLGGLGYPKKRNADGTILGVDERSDFVRKAAWRQTESLLREIARGEDDIAKVATIEGSGSPPHDSTMVYEEA
ncbi:putative c2h2 finger domain protein [Phaeomoniella chlamydospora]|uniref:Putative c2h2 finger domain protein n=1 Tax=Phaeomoniella chlamydospora TaxID=158046 RepID=A0A0G2HGX3_PHACM|nr:putative c2h2 finger domain protein [Phaeomoniella chlamydospora]